MLCPVRTQRWLTVCFALSLAACGSTALLNEPTPKHAPSQTSAPTPFSELPTDIPISHQTQTAQTTGIAPPNLREQALPSVNDPDSYATRSDAAALATELAQHLSLDRKWVWSELSQARFQASVPKLMMPAATPVAKNWAAYRKRFIEPKRIQAGVQFWRNHGAELSRAERAYGVPAHIIVGVLGVETYYGRDMGKYRVLDVLTTLTLDFPSGRSDRSAFFKSELGAFLLMCREQELEPTRVFGSFAGAMGWPQFMPSSFRELAVDFDNDGHIDLTHGPVDAIGSVAHYLAMHGWQEGQATYFTVMPPATSAELNALLAPDIVPSFTPEEMTAKGAMLSPAGQHHSGLLALVQLHNGGLPPSYVAGSTNFYAITRYNQSSYYALAVSQLGEAVSKEVHRQNRHGFSDD
jgi:membrane-bound lytic murein transglycosylase B